MVYKIIHIPTGYISDKPFDTIEECRSYLKESCFSFDNEQWKIYSLGTNRHSKQFSFEEFDFIEVKDKTCT
jgi:hypothetical protein